MTPAREGSGAVEGGASGAAAAFDGNHTDNLMSWMFPNENFLSENHAAMIEELMMWTEAGHLAWCAFVPRGFRL
jgi:hypothetical protein